LLDFVVGADGVVYTLTGRGPSGTERAHEVIALRPDLRELWRATNLGGRPMARPALAKDGVLYVAIQRADEGGALVAIQTGSPGVAATDWPSRRYDARQSGWAP
jgi:hypothetical protein